MQEPGRNQVVYTNKARCRDCYRCVRVCPVKAIRMQGAQASVVEERCIACGTCIRECPQGAKMFRNDVARVAALAASGARIAASVAPSFATVFSDWERRRLASVLRRLGCEFVAETAVGAYMVARETARIVAERPDRLWIGTACPAIVNYVELYKPELVENLTPVVSPMIAHARHLKALLGANWRVVFIGPCVAKKAEAERAEYAGSVEAVLTFAELREWMQQEDVDISGCEESDFDEIPSGEARYFPLPGGLARTASLEDGHLAATTLAVSGFDQVQQAMDASYAPGKGLFVEPLFCSQGCINGPAITAAPGIFERRRLALEYAAEPGADESPKPPSLITQFRPRRNEQQVVPEDEIRRVLAAAGKVSPEDELNCGSCGYASCRENAAAVVLGLAEPEMCVPYMRRLAEQRTDRIIETSPNGILILDDRLRILHMNPAFKKFFSAGEALYGRHIGCLMDPDPFERVASGKEERLEALERFDNYGLVCHQILYSLKEEQQVVGIFVNITQSQASQRKLNELRATTIRQAQELIEHQINTAQQMAKFLGESTARGEQIVGNLVRLAEEELNPKDDTR